MPYHVIVRDNFHYMDESEQYQAGSFDTAERALAASRRIVDAGLAEYYKVGMTAEQLYRAYTTFGEDPFVACDDPDCNFSAWTYAKSRCAQICE